MKKLTAVLLTLMMMTTASFALADYRWSTAETVHFGVPSVGRLISYSSPRLYSFTVEEPGWVEILFDHDWVNSNAYWYIYVMDSRENRIGYFTALPSQEWTESSGRIGLKAGVWYISVESFAGSYCDAEYRLTAHFTSDSASELELNGRMGISNDIALGVPVSGTLSVYDDKDWYRLSLQEQTTVCLNFSHDYVDSAFDLWRVSLVSDHEERQVSMTVYGRNEYEESSDWVTLPAGTWYVKVEHGNNSFDSAVYTLRVAER